MSQIDNLLKLVNVCLYSNFLKYSIFEVVNKLSHIFFFFVDDFVEDPLKLY